MGQGSVAFLSGILLLQRLPELPSPAWIAIAAVPLLLLSFSLYRRGSRLLVCGAAGFLWALIHAYRILSGELPAEYEGRDLFAEGVIVTVPERDAGTARFEFLPERLWIGEGADAERIAVPGRLRLGWYRDAPPLHAGERWRLRARLKRPHGFANPGGFDYEGWLYRKGIRATGYVRADAGNVPLAAGPGPESYRLQHLRQRLGEGIAEALPEREFAGLVTALAIGDYQGIGSAQWEVFRRTGTTHLVAISGMHVSMVAALLFLLVRWIWARAGPAQRLPAPWVAAGAALAGAAGYAALAGFSVPTQRALIMVAAAMYAILRGRSKTPWSLFFLALWGVLLFDPLAVMDAGFWLSFAAVAIILLGMGHRLGGGNWWWRWGRLHLLITVGLAPPLLVLFQQFPLGSPIANFIAVPWVGLAVPIVLAGAALILPFPALGGLLLALAEWILAWLWPLLDVIAGISWLQWSRPAPAGWILCAALLGAVLAICPRGLPGRWLAVLLLLPAMTHVPPAPAPGAVWLTVLDAGQGLAAVLRTHEHVLVYDTGPRFGADFDAGSAVVLPWLRRHGVSHVDTLLVSHGDNDHAGGAPALLRELSIERFIASARDAVPGHIAEPCRRGMSWRWDGVDFAILHPDGDGGGRRNDTSCVLRVSAGGGTILLPGDIETRAERALLGRGDDLRAHILAAPHHGSRSSSSPAFVAAVAPEYVLFATGYRNRWGFPHPEVQARYAAAGAGAWNTAVHGAIEVRVPASGVPAPPRAWRELHQRYWHEPGGERSGSR